MNCRDMENLIQMAIDDILSDKGREVLRAHFEECHECAATYQEYLELDAMLKADMSAIAAPAGLSADIMAVLPQNIVHLQPAAPKKKKKIFIRIAFIATAAALLLVAGFGGWFNPDEMIDDPNNYVADDGNKTTPVVIPPKNDVDPGATADDTQNNGEEGDIDPATTPDDNNEAEGDDIVVAAQPPVDYAGTVTLPIALHGPSSHGTSSVYTVAAFDKYDAIAPRIIDNTITFYAYIDEDSTYTVWNTALNQKLDPVYVGNEDDLPKASRVAGYKDRTSEYGYSYVEALSPDKHTLAYIDGGETAGLYLLDQENPDAEPVLIDAAASGTLLLWAPDGNKLIYTTAEGYLKAYYLEGTFVDIYSAGAADEACWSANSKTVVFSALNPDSGKINIFSINLP